MSLKSLYDLKHILHSLAVKEPLLNFDHKMILRGFVIISAAQLGLMPIMIGIHKTS
jgi:hypothetical protein